MLTGVNVPAGGGSGTVMFQAIAGQQIQITLTGVPTTMQPYGNLIGPSGSQTTTPGTGGASGGVNSSQITISDRHYQLNVLDNSNKGGTVTVRVQVIAGP